MSVNVRNNDIDGALNKLKKQVARDGVLSKARDRADGYKKPGIDRREKKKQGIINSKKKRD